MIWYWTIFWSVIITKVVTILLAHLTGLLPKNFKNIPNNFGTFTKQLFIIEGFYQQINIKPVTHSCKHITMAKSVLCKVILSIIASGIFNGKFMFRRLIFNSLTSVIPKEMTCMWFSSCHHFVFTFGGYNITSTITITSTTTTMATYACNVRARLPTNATLLGTLWWKWFHIHGQTRPFKRDYSWLQ